MAPPTNLPDNVRSRSGPFPDRVLAHWVQELRLFLTRRASRDLVSAVVELAQNIQRHGLDPEQSRVTIVPCGELWKIRAENLATASHGEILEARLRELQGLSEQELRALFRTRLKNPSTSSGEGAGVGLITLCRLGRGRVGWKTIPVAKDRVRVTVEVFTALLDMHVLPPLDLPATEVTPRVWFDSVARTLSLAGESYPEHVADFYQPIQEWVAEYLRSGEPLYVKIALDYLNTSSTKALLDLLELIEANAQGDGRIAVHWIATNETMQEAAEDLLEGFRFPHRISGPETSP